MKTINIENASAELNSLFERANDEDVVIQLPDGREYFLSFVDDFDEEVARSRKSKALMDLLDRRRREYTKTYSLSEAKAKLGLD